MGAQHGHRLHFHGHSPVHRLPARCKVVALVLFVLAVVATPPGRYGAYAVDALALGAAVALSRVPPVYLAKRMVVEVPLVVFALLLPFVAVGERIEVLGVSMSAAGLSAAVTLLLKATLGVIAALLLAATTEPRELLAGLDGLLPRQLVQIVSLMVRYLDVISDAMRRMRIARESRGFSARNPRQWPVLAAGAGTLFVRAYERGERVHLAMLARGYTGTLPGLAAAPASGRAWLAALSLPGVAWLAAAASWVTW